MDDSEDARILGLASGSLAGSFAATRSTIALISDSMTVEWNNGGAEPRRMPSTHFAILVSPAARGRSIRLEFRGFARPVGAGSLAVQIGGTHLNVRPTEEGYHAMATAALSADSDTTPVIVTLHLPKPADRLPAMLTLDTVDATLFEDPKAG